MDEKQRNDFYLTACESIKQAVQNDPLSFDKEVVEEPMVLLRGYLAATAYIEDFIHSSSLSDITAIQVFRLALKGHAHRVIMVGGAVPKEPDNSVYEALQRMLAGMPATESGDAELLSRPSPGLHGKQTGRIGR